MGADGFLLSKVTWTERTNVLDKLNIIGDNKSGNRNEAE